VHYYIPKTMWAYMNGVLHSDIVSATTLHGNQ